VSYNPFYNVENTQLMGYEYAWVNFVNKGEVTENILSEEILSSWSRCKEYGLNPKSFSVPRSPQGNSRLKELVQENKELIHVASPIIDGIVNSFGIEDLHVLVTDREGAVLMDVVSRSDSDTIERKRRRAMILDDASEKRIGTNSMALSLYLDKATSVIGAQHYLQCLHKYGEYAAPIHGLDGDTIGSIAIITRTEEMSDYIMAMVITAAKAVENDLLLADRSRVIKRQNVEKQSLLDNVTDGVVYVDERERISQINLRMENLTGYSKEELIGKKIHFIKTVPALKSVEKQLSLLDEDVRIIMEGRKDKYHCFAKKKPVSGEEDREKYVWIFTTIEDIQILADKINTKNTAYFTFANIVGHSEPILNAKEMAKKASIYETRAIIEGESGTGKEMFAQAIHNGGPRKTGSFVAVDCGAIPRELLESEIFGYEEGAYTGARRGGNRGKFELAHKGTLFLDEINNLSLEMQAKLLRVLQESKVTRLGGSQPIAANVQVIAASNMDIAEEVAKGTFREDLYYRLNIIHIKLPSLRERKEDIPLLIKDYIARRHGSLGKRIVGVDDESMKILCRYDWPGNVRQLNNVLERMAIMSERETLRKNCIPAEIMQAVEASSSALKKVFEVGTLEEHMAEYVLYTVQYYSGNIQRASQALQISRATVYKYLKKHKEQENEKQRLFYK